LAFQCIVNIFDYNNSSLKQLPITCFESRTEVLKLF